VHRSEVLANLTKPMKALVGMVERGELASLLAGDPRPTASLQRRHQRRLSPADVDQLVREYADGLGSIYDLAERWGVHRNTIAKHLRGRGLDLGQLPLTIHEIERVRELRGQGLSLNAIGRAIGRDPKTAKSALSSKRGLMVRGSNPLVLRGFRATPEAPL
jgi:transposase-like protein